MRIIYIDIDTMRADHLGCYGYHRSTSPNIDAIAREGVKFNCFHTPDAPCLPSRAALYSGRFGMHSGVVGHGGSAADPRIEGRGRGFQDIFGQDSLPTRVQQLGFHTALISPFAQRHSAHWFTAGFSEVHDTGQRGMESAERIVPTLDKWLAEHQCQDNWYLHLNMWDPHTPYRAPADFGEPFKDAPLPAWLDNDAVIARHRQMTGPHTPQDVAMYDDREDPKYPRHPGKVTDRASMRKLIDGYDTGILYADQHVGRIVAKLKAAGIYQDTAIIISSDHGENFGELGIYAEHATADSATCRIPFIVKWPGGGKGQSMDGFHYNLDWAPTLLELLGGAKADSWDGSSFAASILKGQDIGREELILSQCCHVCQRSVRFGPWLYMRTYHDGFHLFPDEMLFDLSQDPYEQNNLVQTRPEICHEGAWRLMRWHDEQMRKIVHRYPHDRNDPLWTVISEGGPMHARHDSPTSPLPKYLQRLDATGRSDGAAALRRKYHEYCR